MDNKLLIDVIIIILGLINFFTSFLLFLIHFRQSYFKQRFFKVIYYIITNECLITLIIIVVSFLNIIDVKDIFYIFGVPFYLFFNIIVIYNIQILKYLLNSEVNTDLIKKDIKSTNLSISFTPYNFRKYHIISYLISIIWTIPFFLVIFFFEFDDDMKKFFILIDINKEYVIFIYFVPVYFYAIFSFIYLFSIKFCSTSEKVNLKIYSYYTISTSIIYLLIPIIIYIILKKYNLDDYSSNVFTYLIHLIALTLTNLYRTNCIYVNSVLNSNGIGFCNKLKKALKIIFCRDSVKGLNIIDFNNPYIYHSLSTQFDLKINNDQFIENDANISKFAPDL